MSIYEEIILVLTIYNAIGVTITIHKMNGALKAKREFLLRRGIRLGKIIRLKRYYPLSDGTKPSEVEMIVDMTPLKD